MKKCKFYGLVRMEEGWQIVENSETKNGAEAIGFVMKCKKDRAIACVITPKDEIQLFTTRGVALEDAHDAIGAMIALEEKW